MAEKLDIVNQILMGLQRTSKEIPYHLLYNKEGSELYEEITKLKCYYPYAAEEALLEQHAGEIAAQIAPKSVLVELGCGTARKTGRLLNAVQSRYGSCRFVGIDVSKSALEKAAVYLEKELKAPKAHEMKFIQAEYMQGLKEVRRLCPENMLCILWLGSSIGNLSQTEAISFLKDVTSAVGYRCQLFLCTDMWKDYKRLLQPTRMIMD
ncbi:hypothetical protein O6H91_Y569900 [Diphasiastrum complanatum]|nr:hypothetical protein O6H91_Y569900 [Diphasiastrum complanatum]KAJ7111125.1 hypothetical protein O6H91_Y569900 [Diphasiastrum complanatum]